MGDFGAKARHLIQLAEAGFNVPKMLAFRSIDRIDDVLKSVHDQFDRDRLLVIRSSAANEDGASQSMAGAYHSEVCVRMESFQEAWTRVCDAMPDGQENGVIVQEMILGDFSGVCFSDSKKRRVMINVLPGLCKAVVEGHHADYYEIESGQVVFKHEQDKKEQLTYTDGALAWNASRVNISSNLLHELELLSYRVSEYFGAIQDIEWTEKGGEIFVLQSRPVTANPWKEQTVKIYDSANVGESYSGLVLPLTHTFANVLYAQVYRDLLKHSAVSDRALNDAHKVFDRLVESVYGRMYYRMDNWYAFLRMLPGYERNASNLEHMLMLNARDTNAADVQRPSLRLKLVYYPLVVWKLLRFKQKIDRLKAEAESVFEEAAQWQLDTWSEEEVDQKVDWLMNGVLKRWYLTVENDTVMMSLFAHFSKPGNEGQLKKALAFHSISTDQIAALKALAQELKTDDELVEAVSTGNELAFHQRINVLPKLETIYAHYLKQYGGRFANELKLETPGVEDSFNAFAAVVQLYWSHQDVNEEPSFESETGGWLVRVFKRFAARREVFRLYRANMFGIIRKLVLRKAALLQESDWISEREDVFYLDWDALFGAHNKDWKRIIEEQKQAYKHYASVEPPAYFNVVNGRWPQFKSDAIAATSWQGLGASTGRVQARATVMKTFEPTVENEIGVLVTQRTDPGWTPLMALSKALVVEHGGMLSHASIVARELRIPAVIGIPKACDRIENGREILVDGDTGIVSIQTEETA